MLWNKKYNISCWISVKWKYQAPRNVFKYFPCMHMKWSLACVSYISTTVWSQCATSPAALRENAAEKWMDGEEGEHQDPLIRSMCWTPDSQAVTDRLQQIWMHRHEQRSKRPPGITQTCWRCKRLQKHIWKWCKCWWGTFTGEECS